ncbi:F0F1 ATP synthase subunit delta [Nocardioides nanhaiensis]|uniref:ATP synthase subunit delta n=1 Tax=Nocardioides nanhaiensis TaxID=1476871 RepID=A0ABP8WZC7_9ACTN
MAFRGASADAVAALSGELETMDPRGSADVAGDLFTVADTLRAEGALRRFATDASLPSEAKSGLVGEVFGGKVDEATLTVLRSAVTRRWTVGRDLPDALEHLGVVAVVRSVGTDTGRLADELFAFAQAVKENPELRDALADPVRSPSDKRVLLDSLLGGRALPATITLAGQSLAGSHRTVTAALTEYQKVVASVQSQGVATVRVARPLPDAEVRRLGSALEAQYGHPVHINLLIDPSVIGGIRVEIGDDVIDGTVSSRLDDARRRLVG